MNTQQQNPDGTWTASEPLPLTDDFDVETYGTGPWTWTAYRGATLVAEGTARTRVGLWFATQRARRRTRTA